MMINIYLRENMIFRAMLPKAYSFMVRLDISQNDMRQDRFLFYCILIIRFLAKKEPEMTIILCISGIKTCEH